MQEKLRLDVFGPNGPQNEVFQVLWKINAWNLSHFFAWNCKSIWDKNWPVQWDFFEKSCFEVFGPKWARNGNKVFKVLSKIYAWHLKLHGTSYSNIKTSDMGQIGFSSSWKTIAWNLPDFLRQVAIVCRRYLAVFGPNESRSEPKVRIFRCYKKLMWKDLG